MCGCNGGNQSGALDMDFLSKGTRQRKQIPLPMQVNNNRPRINAPAPVPPPAQSRRRPTMGMFIR
jgi:hypothetical protein